MRRLIIVLLCVGLLLPSISGGSSMILTASSEARPSGAGRLNPCQEIEAEDFATDMAPEYGLTEHGLTEYSASEYVDVPEADIEEGVEVVGWSFAYDQATGVVVCSITLTNNSDVLLRDVEWEMSRTLSGEHTQGRSITCRTAREIGAGDTVTATVRLRARLRSAGRMDVETLGVRAVRAIRVIYYC